MQIVIANYYLTKLNGSSIPFPGSEYILDALDAKLKEMVVRKL